ncbi:Hypothetical predicted protein [Paramuricea clavata]|uniref:Uncharacterized protein n=1 Tax=Paramuricea clavata TaxID=317549 RepID=A0A7D9ERM6_PARCT|nr:Hypothetical predicted protein [Paramuricea clavata]
MAASRKRTRSVDYSQLNSFSSAVLYDTAPKRRKSKFYAVERIIERRRRSQDYEYLIKWQGWPFHSCSWEPSENLNLTLLRSYDQPSRPDKTRFEQSCRNFLHAIQSGLKSKSTAIIYVDMDLDVWRYITCNQGRKSNHKGHILFEREDFRRFEGLPDDWCFILNQHGEGVSIDFPLKAKPLVSWTALSYIVKSGKLVMAPKMPIKKVVLSFAKRACNMDNI